MTIKDFSGKNLECIMAEINYDISLLYVIPCVYTRNMILNHLRERIFILESAMKAIKQPVHQQPKPLQGGQKRFTLQELSKFDGKGDKPAYVAVNGTVYDVTNNAAWAAATHFGLTAGKDLTNEFASCHAGEPILSKLIIVGKMQTV